MFVCAWAGVRRYPYYGGGPRIHKRTYVHVHLTVCSKSPNKFSRDPRDGPLNYSISKLGNYHRWFLQSFKNILEPKFAGMPPILWINCGLNEDSFGFSALQNDENKTCRRYGWNDVSTNLFGKLLESRITFSVF